jgi:chemotaxis protein methyltransferase CheR
VILDTERLPFRTVSDSSQLTMDFDGFLREAGPLLGLQPRPFQRRGIRRKVERRIVETGARNFERYLGIVLTDPREKTVLSRVLAVTISRFFRDRQVFAALESSVFPAAAEKSGQPIQVWSIGCASGEEPYSLVLLWKFRLEDQYPDCSLSVLATDIDEALLQRAREGHYKASSLQEAPPDIVERSFTREGDVYALDPSIRQAVQFRRHDILHEESGPAKNDIVLCRNLAFTYFSKEAQINVLRRIAESMNPDGFLLIGKDEALPLHYPTLFVPEFEKEKIYHKR